MRNNSLFNNCPVRCAYTVYLLLQTALHVSGGWVEKQSVSIHDSGR